MVAARARRMAELQPLQWPPGEVSWEDRAGGPEVLGRKVTQGVQGSL